MNGPAEIDVAAPATLSEALEHKAARPGALPLAGGTDVLVELNFRRSRPDAILDLTRIPELTRWEADGDRLRIGAGVTYTRLIDELGDQLPGLAIASRTVGSLQIRNRGTVGGNLATASPAGDGLPPLYVSGAEVELVSVRGSRRVPVADFVTGPKRNRLEPDELIAAYHLPVAAGPQQFAKVGTRNAMVIAVCSVALALWPRERRVRVCVGSAGPTPITPAAAEELASGALDWDSGAAPDDALVERFGAAVAAAAEPIDDVRGSAAYRRRAVAVLARRALAWAWSEHAPEAAA
jgi:CO/xanthine dehydrogenase FAD-binding subunit